MEGKPNIKGIRIRTLNLIMLFVSMVLFAGVLYTTVQVARSYSASMEATRNYVEWEKATHALHVGSDYLTEEARLYVMDHDPQHALDYFHEINSSKSREHALEFITKSHAEPDQIEQLQRALDLSNALAQREIYAIHLVAEAKDQDLDAFPPEVKEAPLTAADKRLDAVGKIERARDLMFNGAYSDAKEQIRDVLTKVLDKNIGRTRGLLAEHNKELGEVISEQRIALIALCIINILTFAMIILLIVKPLQVYLNCIKNDKMFELVGAYEFKHLALTYNDIFAIKEHHDRLLKHQAEHDPLTGLLNRLAFEDLKKLLKSSTEPVGLALVDVDHFKQINDTYGHIMGDKLLCRVARLLEQSFRQDDFCIRVGGDEFSIVFKAVSPAMTAIVRGKIKSINESLQNPGDNLPKTSISVGVAFSKASFTDNLYKEADAALYFVKERGRCGCAFYHEMNKEEIAKAESEQKAQAEKQKEA